MTDQTPSDPGDATGTGTGSTGSTGGTSTGGTSTGSSTGATTGTGTSSTGGAGSGGAGPIDWDQAFNDLGALGHEVIDRFKERASCNAARVREGTYGANELIDDAEWFWKNFVGDAVRGVEILRGKSTTP